MLIDFFLKLKSHKLPVSIKEYLTLLEAMQRKVIEPSIDQFYYLSRAALVKDEANYDKFDRAFGEFWNGVETIPGIGTIGATAITATVTDPTAFRSGRDFAAWIGLVPRQDSTGGKQKLGPISKQGDRYLRRILVVGAHSVLRRAKSNPEKYPWLTQLLARRPFKVVAIALRTRWRASPGRCWPKVAPIECLRSRQCEKRPSDGG